MFDDIFKMITPYVGGLVRTGAAAAGGWIAGQGWVDGDQKTAIVGGISALGIAGWSMLQKYLAAKKSKA